MIYAATLVASAALSRVDALAVVALARDTHVEGAGTPRPRVALGGGAWVEVEIPKFGDPPPVALDVYSNRSDDHARLEALRLAADLERVAGWSIDPDFEVD
ncbi:hypothetical protein [Schumannella luteola]